MKQKLKNLFLMAIVLAAAVFLFSRKENIAYLRQISVSYIFYICCAGLINIGINGYHFNLLLRNFGVNLPFTKWYGISACNSMINYYIPARGANVIRAIYFKREYDLQYSKYFVLLSTSYIISFFVSSLLGIVIGVMYSIIQKNFFYRFLILYCILLSFTCIVTVIILWVHKMELRTKSERVNNFVNNINEGIEVSMANVGWALKVILLSVVSILIFSLQLYLSFAAIGARIDFFQSAMIQCLASFSMVLSITPANLGIREGIISFSAKLFGLPLQTAIVAAIVSRSLFIIVIFSSGMIFMRVLSKDYGVFVKGEEEEKRWKQS